MRQQTSCIHEKDEALDDIDYKLQVVKFLGKVKIEIVWEKSREKELKHIRSKYCVQESDS